MSRTSWLQDLGLHQRQAPTFFSKIEDLKSQKPPHPQEHSILRAWQGVKLDSVLCQGNTPFIYFKVSDRDFHPDEINHIHKKLWNHSLAPIIVLISNSYIRFYSTSSLPTNKGLDLGDPNDNRLIKAFRRAADISEAKAFLQAAEQGTIFRDYPEAFNPEARVDRHLLRNLDTARSLLIDNKLSKQTVHALLGRTIFTCYLFDRRILTKGILEHFVQIPHLDSLRSLIESGSSAQSRRHLYKLFGRLKEVFNGDLFSDNLREEEHGVTDDHMEILRRFLRAEDVGSGQLTLDFWAYDFSIVPTELISAIYQKFLGEEIQREHGAYYTPRFLAEVVTDIAFEPANSNWATLLDKRYLDPACGSGIFLVAIFNRLASIWRALHPAATIAAQNRALKALLTNNLFGVERDDTACRIAAFSLYLAFLDQISNPDIAKLIQLADKNNEKIFPPLVHAKRAQRQANVQNGNNIFCADFFDADLPLPDSYFDYVLGNPPWKSLKSDVSEDETALLWAFDHKNNYPLSNNQLAQGFVWKTKQHLKPNAIVCFVLPASIIFNHSGPALSFQKEWLSTFSVQKVLNLSDFRFFLFRGAPKPNSPKRGATKPACVVRYQNVPPETDATVEYLTPKTNIETRRAETIDILPTDIKIISLNRILAHLARGSVPPFWKRYWWGTYRDSLFLERIESFPPLLDTCNARNWVMSEGFKVTGKGEISHDPGWSERDLCCDSNIARNVRLVVVRDDVQPIGKRFKEISRERSASVFTAPLVLIPYGFGTALYCDFDCKYNKTIRGISGPKTDRNRLKFLAAVLDSDLSRYYMFHTAANWGIERTKVHLEELKHFPFVQPENHPDPGLAKTIVSSVAAVIDRLQADVQKISAKNPFRQQLRTEAASKVRNELKKSIYQYYGITPEEELLIHDTVTLWEPSANPGVSNTVLTLDIPSISDMESYASTFVAAFNSYLTRRGWRVSADVTFSQRAGSGIVAIRRHAAGDVSRIGAVRESLPELDGVLQRLSSQKAQTMPRLRSHRFWRVTDGDTLYLLKPLAKRFWARSIALNDADDIAMEILSNVLHART